MQVLSSTWFEAIMCMLMVGNCVTLALAVNYSLVQADTAEKMSLWIVECVLTGIFLLEVLAHAWVFGLSTFDPRKLDGRFNFLCAFVTLIPGVLFVWVLTPSGYSFLDNTPSGEVMQIIMLSRFIRLARVYRVTKHTEMLRDLHVLLQGVGMSVVTGLAAFFVLVFVTFAFAVLGTIVIAKPVQDLAKTTTDPDHLATLQNLLDNFVGTLPRMWYTLFKLHSGQITATTFIPMIDSYFGRAWIFFVSFAAVMDLLFMNLITAIIVESAIGRSQLEEQERREAIAAEEASQQLEELSELFELLDDNGDGNLSWKEFKQGMRNREIRRKWKMLHLKPEEAKSCFAMLDREQTGEVPIPDFFDGLRRMQGAAQARDLFYVVLLLQDLIQMLRSKGSSELASVSSQRSCVSRVRTSVTSGNRRSRGEGEDEEQPPIEHTGQTL